jgi:hypothetical protein
MFRANQPAPGLQSVVAESEPAVAAFRERVPAPSGGGAAVEWRQPALSADARESEGGTATLELVDKLLREEVNQLRATLAELELVRERWCRQARSRFERSGDVLDSLDFARCLVDVEEARAAVVALEAQSYSVQEGDHAMPAVAGVRYVGVSVARGDASLFVTIALVVANHGALGAALEYLDVTENQEAAQACEQFNRLSHDQRRALIDRFHAAGEDVRRKDPELVRFFRAGLQVASGDLLVMR